MSGRKVGKEGRETVNGQAEKNRYFTQCHLVVVVVPTIACLSQKKVQTKIKESRVSYVYM